MGNESRENIADEVAAMQGEKLALQGIISGLKAEREEAESQSTEPRERLPMYRERVAPIKSGDDEAGKDIAERMADAEAEIARMKKEAEDDIELIRKGAGRVGRKAKEYRRLERAIRKAEKKLNAAERSAEKATAKDVSCFHSLHDTYEVSAMVLVASRRQAHTSGKSAVGVVQRKQLNMVLTV